MTNAENEIIHEKESIDRAVERYTDLLASWKDLPNHGPGANVRNQEIVYLENRIKTLKDIRASLPVIVYT